MKTRGAVLFELGTPWSIEEIEIGAPQKGEVPVRMVAAGLCHSDHHVNTGRFASRPARPGRRRRVPPRLTAVRTPVPEAAKD
jgi:Zn-dependent alcohol dehydrogenase